MKKLTLSFFAIILYFLPASVSYASQLLLPALERACLPVVGRMQKGEIAPCHCPPQRLCPFDVDEWNEAKLLPQSIANVCCDKPKACATTQVVMLACGQASRIDQLKDKFCYRHEMRSNNYNSPIYTSAKAQMNALENQIVIHRNEIMSLTSGAETPSTYGQVVSLLTLIHNLEAAIKALENQTNNNNSNVKIDIRCQDTSTINLCTSRVSNACPVVDPPPSCRMSGIGFARMSETEKADFLKKCPFVEWYDCVAEGSMILMADGTQKPIEQVRIGEYVKGYTANNRVTGMSLEEEGAAFLMSINDGKLNITPQHPILTTKGWKAIHPEKVMADETFKATITKLEVGDEILIPDEGVLPVTKIGNYEGAKVQTFNLSVNGDKTFIANGMVIRAFAKNNTY